MKKEVKENYEAIIKDLEPLFDKWGATVINGAMWRYTRTKSRKQELLDEQIRIEKELAQYEKTT